LNQLQLSQRPEGQKLVQAIAKKRARHILTLKLDRLFRSAADALDQTAQWDKGKVALHILDMGGSIIDTTSAMGRMFFTMMAGFAEMERNLISERTRTALRHKKAASRVYCRMTPLGFDRQGDKLIQEMKVVRKVLALRAQGLSMQTIADAMNQAGAPTKQGGKWHAVTIQKVLRIHGAPAAA
jgi:DNA invertase Pin-like site-specific DNA recombinase